MTIIAEKISKSFFDPEQLDVLKDISLTLHPGQSIAICGRSGEGKTTLLQILGTLEEPDHGRVVINGTQANRRNAARLRSQSIGFIFQSFNLLEDFTVLDNVLMPARIIRQPIHSQSEAYHDAINRLRRIGLLDRLHSPAKLLSGGERQRVAIARALCNSPSLIIADEPSGNLDRSNAIRIGDLLLECVHDQKKGLILATHDLDLAALCQKRYLLQGGKLSLS
jgi:lipoprotein-releasing system ATP-binding protein